MMNRSLEILKDIYCPYRYTIKGKSTILETTSGNVVVKPKDKDIKEVYQYLQARGINNFPLLVENNRDGVNVFEFVEDISQPKEQKAQDMINIIAQLHQKTAFYKPVSQDTYQEIYENILGNINYYRQFYENFFDRTLAQIYMSPSHYFLMRNCSKIFSSLNFAEREVNEWFSMVKKEDKQRVSYIHNNLSLEHYRKSDKDYLISWDKSKIDSPVLDLVEFYHKEFFDLEFKTLFEEYQKRFPWSEEEKKLFFVLISLPKDISFSGNELMDTKAVRENLDYLYKTESLIRPYYAVE